MKTKAAYLVLLLLLAFVMVPLISLFFASDMLGGTLDNSTQSLAFWEDSYLRQVIYFTLLQATLSTFFSVFLGLIVAYAFAHFGNFPFRSLILGLFGLPLVVPAVVAVLGIVSVYGSHGWFPLGSRLYGLPGILLAHLFFNLPLSVRLLLPVWDAIPQQHWRMGAQLQMSRWQHMRHIEWPALRESLPSVAVLVFMLCLTSFAVVLTLGGGPKSTTLEVAIYQSLRFDFNPEQAVILALLQLLLSVLIAIIASKFSKLPELEPNLSLHAKRLDVFSASPLNNVLFSGIIIVAILFVASPILAMLIDAAKAPFMAVMSDTALWKAAGFSLIIGLCSAAIAIVLGWILLFASAEKSLQGKNRQAQLLQLAGSVVYVVPPLVIGTGLFILLSQFTNIFDWAILIVILINGMMGLPFVIRTLGPAIRQNTMYYQRLSQSLNIGGYLHFKLVALPLLRKPLALSAALVTVLAMGDLGIIALFGTPDTATLSLLLYQRLSAYQMPQAAVVAAFLLSSCLFVFWLIEKLVGGDYKNKNYAGD